MTSVEGSGQVTVKLFAWLRDLFGEKELRVSVDRVPDVASLLRRLRDLSPDGRGPLSESGELEVGFMVLLNGHNIEFAGGMEAPLADGDEVAVFPPIAGG